MGRWGSGLGLSGGESIPVEGGFASRRGARATAVGPGRREGRAALAPAAPPCSGTTLAWARCCPKNHGHPAAQVAWRRVCSQGDLLLLVPRALAGDNGVLFGRLRPPWLLLLSREHGCVPPGTRRELLDVYRGARATCWVRAAVFLAGGCGLSWLGGYLPPGAEEGAPSPVKRRGNSEMWVFASLYSVLAA